jgi:DNA recombination protein RmuC
MSEHMAGVGASLTRATRSYNDMVGSMESRVLPAARKFEELQYADPNKLIEEPQQVELAPRQLTFLDTPSAPVQPLAAKRK